MAWWETVDWQDPINRQCSLNRGLVGWWMGTPLCFGGTRMVDLLNRNHGTLTNMDPATDWVATEYGPAISMTTAGKGCEAIAGAHLKLSLPITWAFDLYLVGTPEYTAGLFGVTHNNTDTSPWMSFGVFWQSGPRIIRNFGGVHENALGAATHSIGERAHYVCGLTRNGHIRMWKNSKSVYASSTDAAGPTYTSTSLIHFGNYTPINRNSNCIIQHGMILGAEPTSHIASSLYDQWRRGFPDQLNWLPQRPIVSVPASPVVGSRLLNLRRRSAAA